MSLSPVVTQAQLELKVGVQTVAQFASDSGAASSPAVVNDVLQKATDRGAGALRSAFTADQIPELVANDSAAQDAFLGIALGMLGDRRPQLRDERGKTAWWDLRAESIKYLEEVAEAHKRSIAEGVGSVPNNPLTRNRTNYDRPFNFVFASTKNNPGGSGGF